MFEHGFGDREDPIEPVQCNVIPRWRDDFEPSEELIGVCGEGLTKTSYKVVEILRKYIFELMSREILLTIKLDLGQYIGDRELEVVFTKYSNGISVSYIEDNGKRSEIKLGST